MAKFVANMTFDGYAEKKRFQKGVVFEMSVKRAKEIEEKIQKDYPEFNIERVEEME